MSAPRRLRNFWILWVTTVVLACFSNAVAQASYKVTDLGTLGNDNLGCAMSVNNEGWTEIMAGNVDPSGNSLSGTLLNGRAVLGVDGFKIDLGTLPGDFGSLASGISSKGQVVVGSTWDSNFDWSHAFIWQNGVMTDLNTLLPASSNLYATMANKINERGQISGMATVLTGPHAGDIHAFLATPVNESIGTSVAAVARTHPKSNVPANVGNQLLQRFGLGQFGR
ncbi:MAG: hypothetical protein WCA20_36215 [Candidatus Sulfotelmatobacter sp.]